MRHWRCSSCAERKTRGQTQGPQSENLSIRAFRRWTKDFKLERSMLFAANSPLRSKYNGCLASILIIRGIQNRKPRGGTISVEESVLSARKPPRGYNLGAQACARFRNFLTAVDSFSGAEVTSTLHRLNAEVPQSTAFMAESMVEVRLFIPETKLQAS